MAWKVVPAFLLCLCVACGGGGNSTEQSEEALTAQQLIEDCVAGDVQDLAGLLDVLQNLLDPEAEFPTPQLNVLQFLIDGTIGWSLDLDEDGAVDISGTVGFKDPQGQPTLPLDLDDVINGQIPDLETVLANITAGSSLELSFELAGALAQTNVSNGALTFLFGDEGIASVSGDGIFESGACAFDFDFSNVGAFDPTDGFPIASLGFGLNYDDRQNLGGSIELDGTNVAEIRAALDGGLEQVFKIDLDTGSLID